MLQLIYVVSLVPLFYCLCQAFRPRIIIFTLLSCLGIHLFHNSFDVLILAGDEDGNRCDAVLRTMTNLSGQTNALAVDVWGQNCTQVLFDVAYSFSSSLAVNSDGVRGVWILVVPGEGYPVAIGDLPRLETPTDNGGLYFERLVVRCLDWSSGFQWVLPCSRSVRKISIPRIALARSESSPTMNSLSGAV